MKYLEKKFTVAMTSEKYRSGYDQIDWGKGDKTVWVAITFKEDGTTEQKIVGEKDGSTGRRRKRK